MTADAPKVDVHMTVSDLEKSRAFYEKFLGTAPVKVKPGYVKFLPAFGPLNLALSQAAPSEGHGHIDHMGIQVESAEWEVYVRNYDLEETTLRAAAPATSGVTVVSADGCCAGA